MSQKIRLVPAYARLTVLYVAVPAFAPNMDGVMETLSVHLPSLVISLKQNKATVSGTASALESARVTT